METKGQVLCISEDEVKGVKVGNVYEILDETDSYFLLERDNGTNCYFRKNCFEPVVAGTKEIIDDVKEKVCLDLSKDEVKNRTGHYTVGGIEPFDVHKSMGIFSEFAKGNIIKYTMRQGKKLGEDINDLKKIVDYALSLALYEGVNPEDLKGIFEDRIKRHKKEGN